MSVIDVERPLTVVVPCFNEEATVAELLGRVLESPYVGEVVVVDDASSDGTVAQIESVAAADDRVQLLRHEVNRGKGAGLRTGFDAATRPVVIIQDADLEYDPAEYHIVIGPILRGDADVVYGSRFKGAAEQRVLYFWHSVANRALTIVSNAFTDLNLTDMETCFKAFRREIIQGIEIEEDRFGFEPEVTAKVAAMRCRIYEVGISYRGRTYEEGKKIGFKDAVRALCCILAYSPLGRRVGARRILPVVGRLAG